ncbi:MAG: hypothetical protein HOM21_07910 [Halobacteriovoraceae bacterium]|nr:hypothetical protein [Halobacteriovoraceae bacterium]
MKNQSNNNEQLVKENDLCICMEIYQPVCSSDGKTYANSCLAGCSKAKRITNGPCQ